MELSFRTYTTVLSAGIESPINIDGDTIVINRALFSINVTTEESLSVDMDENDSLKLPFNYHRLVFLSAVDQTVEITMGFGKISKINLPMIESRHGERGIPTYPLNKSDYPLDLYFTKVLNDTTLAAPSVVDDNDITLAPGHGGVIGNEIDVSSTLNGSHFMQSQILNVVGDVITLDTPSNRIYTVADTVVAISYDNMNVDGSVTPVVFSVKPLINQSGDFYRIIVRMTDNVDMDFETFGGITALTNGVVVRVNEGNGNYRTIVNFKSNGDIENFSYDSNYFTNKAGGVRGFSSRMTFNGKAKHGVVIRLDGARDESLEIVVQDDLTGLTSMLWIAQGSEILTVI